MPASEITRLLLEARAGSRDAEAQLLQAVYPELKAIAANLMRSERERLHLQTTGLVHDAYIRLFGESTVAAANRSHFFFLARRVMRQILTDSARARLASKRTPPQLTDARGERTDDGLRLQYILDLNRALDRLEAVDKRVAAVVELKFFCDLDLPSIAETLKVSERTVGEDWRFAKKWLKTELGGNS
ncbi:MAG: ECF-type sigma factor [Bryobacteraceae bacterium]|nr:ECF-type sigma factor [Bryobacteraceae bacterium]